MDNTTINYPLWLTTLGEEMFNSVADAGERLVSIHEALLNDGITLQAELFRDCSDKPITAWEHYPADDCRDPQSGAMYYYHAHEAESWHRDEHGHFHLFVRPSVNADFTHVMAIAMTAHGLPNALFSTNGWVTDEKMLPANDVMHLLEERWQINRARPSWLVTQWLSAMISVLHPFTEKLLQLRDQQLTWSDDGKPMGVVLEDRSTHILSELPLDLMAVLQAIQEEAQQRINKEGLHQAYG
jgi:hypothetical protein